MRPSRRAIKVQHREVLPERSRLTIGRTVAALRHSREALVDIENQLDDLLARVRSPGTRIEVNAPDRLASAAGKATEAMATLHQLGHLFA
jgi:hypothetical protein